MTLVTKGNGREGTNGRRLSYESFARGLLESGITDLLISLHGPTAEIHEQLTNAPGSFEQTVAGIENAVRLNAGGRVALGVNTTLTRDNFARLGEFATLLRRTNAIVGIERIRFTSPHPSDMTARLIEAMATCDKVCPQLHLPVQSGSDRVLARMERGYTVGEYLALVERVRAAIPAIALTTDIIQSVGTGIAVRLT